MTENPNVATVDEHGKVIALRNGSVLIKATDATGTTVSYPVSVTHNYDLYQSDTEMTFAQAKAWIARSPENIPISLDTKGGVWTLRAMSIQFRGLTACQHHTGVLESNGQQTQMIVTQPGNAPVASGPVALDTRARALCYRERK
jgi:hypothetical protein